MKVRFADPGNLCQSGKLSGSELGLRRREVIDTRSHSSFHKVQDETSQGRNATHSLHGSEDRQRASYLLLPWVHLFTRLSVGDQALPLSLPPHLSAQVL